MAQRKDAWFTDDELAKFNHRLEQVSERHRYEEDPDKYIQEHRQLHCRVYHAGRLLVHGEGFQPERLVKERK